MIGQKVGLLLSGFIERIAKLGGVALEFTDVLVDRYKLDLMQALPAGLLCLVKRYGFFFLC